MSTTRLFLSALAMTALISTGCADDPAPTTDATAQTDHAGHDMGTQSDVGPETAECSEPLLTLDPLGALADPEANCSLSGDPTGQTFVVDFINIDQPDNAAVTGAINPNLFGGHEGGRADHPLPREVLRTPPLAKRSFRRGQVWAAAPTRSTVRRAS